MRIIARSGVALFAGLTVLWVAGGASAQVSGVPIAGTSDPSTALLFNPEESAILEDGPEDPFDDPIENDRDSFTRSPKTVGKRGNAFEVAYTFLDQPDAPEGHSLPEFLVRYGFAERVEARLGWSYEAGVLAQVLPAPAEESADGGVAKEYSLNYGVKIRTTKQDGWVPDSSLIFTGYTPTGGESNLTTFSAEYVFGWDTDRDWQFDTQLRYFYLNEEGDHFNEWAPSVVVKKTLCRRWNLHAEYFGLFSAGRDADYTQHYFTPGVHFLITPDVEVGLRVGWGLNDQSANFFSNVGVGWRF